MNKHILLVMKWLKDPTSVTQKELSDNHTAYAAAAAAYAEKWVGRYFECSGDDRQQYVDALEDIQTTTTTTVRKSVAEAAINRRIGARCFQLYRNGEISYQDMLEMAVLQLLREKRELIHKTAHGDEA